MLERLFLAHPRSVGESYFEHMRQALQFAGWLLLGGVLCAVHALLPAAFGDTASSIVAKLHDRMVRNRHRARAVNHRAAAEASGTDRAGHSGCGQVRAAEEGSRGAGPGTVLRTVGHPRR